MNTNIKALGAASVLLCALGVGAVHAADGRVTTRPEIAQDLRNKCEMLTGNERLTCMDQVRAEEKQSGSRTVNPSTGAASNSGAGTTTRSTGSSDRALRNEKRAEGREAVATQKQKCEMLTGNERLTCMDQMKDRPR